MQIFFLFFQSISVEKKISGSNNPARSKGKDGFRPSIDRSFKGNRANRRLLSLRNFSWRKNFRTYTISYYVDRFLEIPHSKAFVVGADDWIDGETGDKSTTDRRVPSPELFSHFLVPGIFS
jgi:hypothetical protein